MARCQDFTISPSQESNAVPGMNLTRDEAAARAALIDVESYTVELDLTTSETTFRSTTVIQFTCREAGSSTFVDLVAPSVHELTLNGRALDPATVFDNVRIQLDDLPTTTSCVSSPTART